MNPIAWLTGETVEVMVDVDIERTWESFHAYTVPDGIEMRPGDEMIVHGVPTDIPYGERFVSKLPATVYRAGLFGRVWTRFASTFDLTELYEVGFQSAYEGDLKLGRAP